MRSTSAVVEVRELLTVACRAKLILLPCILRENMKLVIRLRKGSHDGCLRKAMWQQSQGQGGPPWPWQTESSRVERGDLKSIIKQLRFLDFKLTEITHSSFAFL